MNNPETTKKISLTLTRDAIAQVKRHDITKAVVLDVMKNRSDRLKLDDGQFKFTGSAHHPNTHITAKFLPKKQQWVITDIQVRDTEPKPAAPPKNDQHKAIVFTNHAQKVLKQEFIDHRVVEQLIDNPDKKYDEDDGKVRFIGWVHGDKLHVIAKFLPEEHKWLVITIELRYESTSQADISEFDGEPTDEHPGITFTTHALERMELRSISPYEVQQTILDPEKTFPDGGEKIKFIGKKLSQNRTYQVIGKFLPEENKWSVISVWVRGEEDDGSLSTWQPRTNTQDPYIAFTNNVREWMKRQQVDEDDLKSIIQNPLERHEQEDGKVKFIGKKAENGQTIHVIGKFLPVEQKWLVITTWQPRTNTQAPYIAFTNSVREWMKRQGVSENDLKDIVQNPLKKQDQEDGKVKFIGMTTEHGQTIHVIGKFLPAEQKWLVITAWVPNKKHHRNNRKATQTEDTTANLVWTIIFVIVALGGIAFLLYQSFLGG